MVACSCEDKMAKQLPQDMLNKTWVLVKKEINKTPEVFPENDTYPVTLTFFPDNKFHGRHDANVYEGAYSIQSDKISLTITNVTDVSDIEWYLDYIDKLLYVSEITLTDTDMQMSNIDNSLIFNFVSKAKFEQDYFGLEEWYNLTK
jgi:hypothetical protein